MCRLRDCSVCECPESEFPEIFKKPHYGLSPDDPVCQEGKPQAAVDRTIDNKAFRGWTETDNPWTNDDETDNCSYHIFPAQFNGFYCCGYLNICVSLFLLIPVKRVIFKMIICSSVDVNVNC
jgi:ERO1-like protein alpha